MFVFSACICYTVYMDKMKLIKQDVEKLLTWYQQNKRDLPWRQNTDPYRVWISEIMAQQTRISAVIPYFNRFVQRVPDVFSLANLPQDELMKLWEGLGYYSRARNLQAAAKVIVDQYGGVFPSDYDSILSLPGIGEYTASAIGSISFDIPAPVVDGNVLRVFCRYLNDFSDIASPKTKKNMCSFLQNVIPHHCPGEFNQAVMELGALICAPNSIPACDICPLQNGCLALKNNNWDMLPVKSAKSTRKEENYTIVLVCCDDQILLKKRKSSGLLADLYQYVMLDGKLDEKQVCDYLKEQHIQIQNIHSIGENKHIFTHKQWNMSGYFVTVSEICEFDGYTAVSLSELTSLYPLPSAFKLYTDFIKEYHDETTTDPLH